MDPDERTLFATTLREAIAAATEPNLDSTLGELGWIDAFEDDPQVAVSVLFEAQGEASMTSCALHAVLADALGFEPDADLAVVLPTPGGTSPPASAHHSKVTVRGFGLGSIEDCARAVVATVDDAQRTAAFVVPTEELELTPAGGIDPRLALVEVSAVLTGPELRPVQWVDAVAAGQIALAHELLGGCRAMLRLARDHAVNRVQFGRPVSAFQAVRHRLADGYVAVESAEAAIAAAWRHPTELTATMSKVVAGESARTVGRHAQQVLAGVGFTAEHPFHRYLFRTMVLDMLFGDARSLTDVVGGQLLSSGQLPEILPL